MTSKAELKDWFERGFKTGYAYMIVVVDTGDHEHYPVYVSQDQDIQEFKALYDGQNMQRIMEVYDLSAPFEVDSSKRRFDA